MSGKEQTKPNIETEVDDDDDFVSVTRWQVWEEPGEFLKGTYLGYQMRDVRAVDGSDDIHKLPLFQILNEGGIVNFIGGTQLQKLMNIMPGLRVKIVYEGEKKLDGVKRLKLFDIMIGRADFQVFREKLIAGGGLKVLAPALITAEHIPESAVADIDDVDPFADPQTSINTTTGEMR